MDSGFLTFILAFFFAVYSSPTDITDWDDVVVARVGMPTTLVCADQTVRGAVTINWKVRQLDTDGWQLVLTASEKTKFSGGASKPSMRLTDPNFKDTGNFSLSFQPGVDDSGLYSCLIEQQERKQRETFILLAVLAVSVVPASPVPQYSTLRLMARVTPNSVSTKINWVAPGDISMKTEKKTNSGTIAKLPQVQTSDGGSYICMVQARGSGGRTLFPFNVDVTVDADKVASFTNITHGPLISTTTQALASFPLTCPDVQGDYILLHWLPPDMKKHSGLKLVYQYDRWRGSTLLTEQSKRIQLAGPPYNAEAGSFSFVLTPGLRDGGLYLCEVYLNDNVFSQRTRLTVVKVITSRSSSNLELKCLYTERSQVKIAKWKHHNESRQLAMSSSDPGRITTTLPLPITQDTAGNYTCVLELKNGRVVRATQVVPLPPEVSVSVTPPSLLPSLSALLLLVPLVAAAVGVLLWRQKHISDRGIEQSLSVQPCEAENIYENPGDRQAAPQGSVYMDLKPRGEDDVYKELERYELCQS
ncbi:g6f-like [Salarias fasciatus]|uniref:Uncharacterized LOC115396993 n=1 Tax=Salarias fasciatus TaxID=181472 RepID=A0A672HPC6_SALFA|nr:uncharacterized protein LOC115396993 [Salarias fasciatus]